MFKILFVTVTMASEPYISSVENMGVDYGNGSPIYQECTMKVRQRSFTEAGPRRYYCELQRLDQPKENM